MSRLYPVYFDCEDLDDERKKKIQTHFQIRRKSGGGECDSVRNVSGKVYRVDFKEQQAQQRVLERREHRVDVAGSSLLLVVRDGPGPAAAGPVSSPKQELPASPLRRSSSSSSLPPGGDEHEVHADTYLLHYLRDGARASAELNDQLRPLHSAARLCPEDEKAVVRSSALFVDAEASETWKAEVESVFDWIKAKYLCRYVFEAEDRALLLKSCNTCQDQGDVKVYSESDMAVVVGPELDVEARLKHVRDHHAKIRGASLGRKQKRKRIFDKAKFNLLRKEVEQSLAQEVPGLVLTEEEKGQLVFEGTVEEIKKAYDVIDEKEKLLKEETVSDVGKRFVAFLNKAYSSGESLSSFLGSGESVVFELSPLKIKIFSLSANDIKQTVKALKEKVKEEQMEVPNCVEVPLELRNLLKSEEKQKNKTGLKVWVDFAENNVMLLGHVGEVKELHAAVEDFIFDQLNVEHRVQVPFPELTKELPELLTLNGFDFTGVNFTPLHSGFVALEGPSSTVTQIRSKLMQFLQSLVKENVIIDKPGALRYFKTQNGAEKLLEVAGAHKCLVRLEDAAPASEGEEIMARFVLKHGVQVIVHLGDITKQEADVLVNAANEELRHGGGVALALSKAGGPEVQKESSELVKCQGKIRTGNVVMTGGGKLKCKKLLHAVGPEKHKAGGREKIILEETVLGTLVLAESLDFVSIALPCISSGVFGVPVDVCCDAIVSAVRTFAAGEDRRLRKITLIDQRREVVLALKAACGRLLRDAVEVEGAGSAPEKTGAAPQGAEKSVRVEIVQGTFKSQQVDCLVCPMLGHQPVSLRVGKVLESVTGATLTTRFNQVSGGGTLPGGTVVVEGLPGLLSNAVVFLNLMNYTQQQEHAKQVLKEAIRSALSSCEGRGFRSVAFPVLGTGVVLQFPVNVAALVLLQEIQTFERKRAAKTPFHIRIVIHPNEKDASKAFQTAQQTVHLKGFTNDADPNHASFYRLVSSAPSEVSALMGGVTVQIVQGDIIHEKSHVIVNSTNFKSEPAGVCKAILTAAGPNIQAELKRAGESADYMCSTGGGLLACKEIVHVQTGKDPQGFNKTCKNVLKLCESKGYASVSFPAINTGIAQMALGVASRAMLDAMAAAIRELSPKSVALIRIVILLPPVFDAFRTELESRFGQAAPPQNFFGKMKKKFKKSRKGAIIPPTKAQPAVFSAIACSSAAISALKEPLESQVQKQLKEKEFEFRDLCRLTEMEVAAVQAKARSFGVSLDHGVRPNANSSKSEAEKIIVLRGLNEDVLVVADLVNRAIKNALSEDLRERDEESLAQRVQWMYLEDGKDWENFSLQQNFILEEANNRKDVFVETEINGNGVRVNLVASDATDERTGKKYSVNRCEVQTDIELPDYWNPMAGENFKKIELDPTSKEYQRIAQEFHKTAKQNKIQKIERVQNFHLWRSFFVMRQKMLMKNGEAELGDQYLYHGTSAESCECIEKDRFDRSYTGRNGAWYGKGVYFAVNASYSAHNSYSRPDAAGLKRMYVARVLTGRHTVGDRSMLAPPPRGSDPSDRYDSLVDNQQNPTMFVIFHDDQAYPEYLITFS